MSTQIERLVANLNTAIVGKQDAIRLVLVALLSRGHALLEDVPGVWQNALGKVASTVH